MSQRIRLWFLTVLLVVGLPAVLAHGYYRLTGDPTLQPLSQAAGDFSDRWLSQGQQNITVHLDWGEAANSFHTRSEVSDVLRNALDLYGVDFRITDKTVPGNRITVTYTVGIQSYGPYTLGRAASGMELAIAALGRE